MSSSFRPNQRVYVIMDGTDKEVRWLGFGKYLGDFPLPHWDDDDYIDLLKEDYPQMTPEERKATLRRLSLNPKIELEQGGTVWGCEVWWGDARDWDQNSGGRQLTYLTYAEFCILRGESNQGASVEQ